MARGTVKFKVRKTQISKKLDKIIKALDKFEQTPEQIAQEGLQTAQINLAVSVDTPEFTQKHGMSLVDEIGVRQVSEHKYEVYAPVTQGDNEIAYEMYFAEYGAGLGASMAKNIPTGATELVYIPTQNRSDGYWWYPYVEPKEVVNKKGETIMASHGFTNTSIAVNYMWSARQTMKFALNREIAKCEKLMKIKFNRTSAFFKTSITRPKGG